MTSDPLPGLSEPVDQRPDAAADRSATGPDAAAGTATPGRGTPVARSAGVPAEELLAGLNGPQRQAVTHTGGPVLVVAGAGSGKTRVLTRRIAWLVGERNVHPGSILAITFTNKAAAEMRHRVEELVGRRARMMWVSTFHSACARILRSEISHFGMSSSFSIYDDADAKRLMQLVAADLGLDPKKYPVRSLLNWVSKAKNELRDFETAKSQTVDTDEAVQAEAYAEYQRRLVAANALDFDDLIMHTVHLFQGFAEVRQKYRKRFAHVLVDEYQDTNTAQYALIRELCLTGADGEAEPDPDQAAPELMVVGDSDQSIYAFRGASIRNILDFESDFPGAETVLLEQNYRSTQNILSAANAVITRNTGRPVKRLWSDAGDGDLITGYVADTEYEEAEFISSEISALRRAGKTTWGEVAVFFRTNAQSRAFEEVLIRSGHPYRVVGAVRFYERREVRDAIAYLRAIANPADDVSVRRILNVPKRGIGDRAEAAIAALAERESISFSDALARHTEAPGLATRSAKQIASFVEFLERHRRMATDGTPADEVLSSVLTDSGYLEELQNSSDPQDQSRIENLAELVAVAAEFVATASAVDLSDVADDDEVADDDSEEADDGEAIGLADGSPEPDPSLSAFLERVALVSDADQVPDGEGGEGVVTLMTLHTAKGLEFDTVFLSGMEEGLFPHQRALTDPAELEEERRLAYVGLTRARKRLYLTRAERRTMWGAPQYNPASRFIAEIPDRLFDWRKLGGTPLTWAGADSSRRRSAGPSPFSAGPKQPRQRLASVEVGEKVLHSVFGLGTVVATSGSGEEAKADVDFGSAGTKRLALRHAPLEKL
ncbi:UvrD-helicase domain-containing protein [Naumannella halotolerans]|uniref:UvrD-helicase domain-containing protein n=1 Tax=Naumannella halotolerans TaxID=993414 RepID=UPI00370D893E